MKTLIQIMSVHVRIKEDKNITDKKKMNMENKLKILEIMRDYEKEEEKERHEYNNKRNNAEIGAMEAPVKSK